MSLDRWRRASHWLLAGAIAANAIATCLRERNEARRLDHALGDGFVDYVSLTEREVAGLARHLDERGYVQYVTDIPGRRIWQEPRRFVRLGLLQYAVAPAVLGLIAQVPARLPDGRLQKTFLLADFSTADELDAFLEANDCELRWRRGGIALLRRR